MRRFNSPIINISTKIEIKKVDVESILANRPKLDLTAIDDSEEDSSENEEEEERFLVMVFTFL